MKILAKIFFSLFLLNTICLASESSTFEVPLEPYIEILGSDWNSKQIDEIVNATNWEPAYSNIGKQKMSYSGNWYRLRIDKWLPDGNWILLHPLASQFTFYRNLQGQLNISEHGYKSKNPDRISYRKTAVLIPALNNNEILYFKVSGMSNRSSHHPLFISPTHFVSLVSQEVPFVAFYYSLMLVVALISLFAFFMLWEKIYLYYGMHLIASIGVFLGIQGYTYQYSTHWVPGYSMFFFGMVNFFIILFISDLFKFNSKKYYLLTYFIAGLSLTFSIFSLSGLTALVFDGLYTVVTGTQLLIVIISMVHVFKNKNDRWILIFISLSFFISSLGLLNDRIAIPMTELIDDAYQPSAFIEALLFAFILLKRFYLINIDKKNAIELARMKTLESVKLESEKEKMRAHAMIGENAAQIAHDIRSPLSALTLMVGNARELPEEKRIVIRSAVNRINDIANSLLQKSRIESNSGAGNNLAKLNETLKTQKLCAYLLSPLIDSIVSEKRIQFREKQAIEIEADIQKAYGIFANINATELKRTISNLINNAVEAMPNDAGKIIVTVKKQSEQAVIIIQDTGKGIPESILMKLGEIGITHGKEGSQSGSGLGIYHAKKTVVGAGGKFHIESCQGKGTTITISFDKALAPKWFVERLIISPRMSIASLDDDISIHQIWRGRFESQNISSVDIKHNTFTSGSEFKSWISSQSHESIQRLYLVDYELLNQNSTGLDIIEELGVGPQSILVTSRYEEEKIRERCDKMGVKLIPKAMAGFVPIEIEKSKVSVDGILVDDDSLVHSCWQMDAESKGKKFIGYYNALDFLESSTKYDINTKIYVDSNLGNGIKGEDVSLKIHTLGFKNIYLCTGYQPSQFPKMPWIKDIVGKEPQL